MVAKLRTHNRFSFSVRMKRSATSLPSGSRTKLGELWIPEERDLLLKIVGQVVRPVVVTQPQPTGHAVKGGVKLDYGGGGKPDHPAAGRSS